MTKHCESSHDYEHEGRPIHVGCELSRGHEGKCAAWTWERPPYPRVEWEAAKDYDIGPPLSYEDAVRYGRGFGIDTNRLDWLEANYDKAMRVDMPDGRRISLEFHWTVERGNYTGPMGLPALREIADAALAAKQIVTTELADRRLRFVLVTDEMIETLKAAPTVPVTVKIEELPDGELLIVFTEYNARMPR